MWSTPSKYVLHSLSISLSIILQFQYKLSETVIFCVCLLGLASFEWNVFRTQIPRTKASYETNICFARSGFRNVLLCDNNIMMVQTSQNSRAVSKCTAVLLLDIFRLELFLVKAMVSAAVVLCYWKPSYYSKYERKAEFCRLIVPGVYSGTVALYCFLV
jgi:hypothetical protein